MVVELQGFGPVPGGAEDPGNESEAELDTSKMVQVGKLRIPSKLTNLVFRRRTGRRRSPAVSSRWACPRRCGGGS